jgi:hypothetical protein
MAETTSEFICGKKSGEEAKKLMKFIEYEMKEV